VEANEAAARLRQRPRAVQPYLWAVLQECLARVPPEQDVPRQWLTAVLAVEPDPWLKEFRQAVGQRAWTEVAKLAAQAEVGRYHPAVLVGLTRNLPEEARVSKMLLLRRTQQRYPGDFWVNFDLGHALYLSIFPRGVDRLARAEELPVVNEAVAFRRVAVSLRPDNAPAHTNLGIALKAQGDLKGAIACYQRALELDPRDAKAHVGLGTVLADQGDLSGAIASFKRALALDPKDALAHFNLGNMLKAQGDVKGAIACFTRALDLNSKDAPTHNNLGLALQAQGDLKGAIACYRNALKLDPKLVQAQGNLGTALQAQGNLKEAIDCYHKVLMLDPKHSSAHFNLGLALQAQGDLKGAITSYKKALDLRPKDAQAHNNLGNALHLQGDVKGAIACYHKALKLDPKYVLAHNNLGMALQDQGDVKGAIACYTKALELDPKYAHAYYNLGNALRAQKDVQGAIVCFKKAVTFDPKYAHAYYNLGLGLYATQDLSGAIACYKKALDLDPKDSLAHGALGQALLAQGAFKEARAATQQALHLLPADDPVRPLYTRQLHECQRLLELDARLTAIGAGDDHPRDRAEQLALAELCAWYKKRYTAAVRFYQGAFAAQPKLPAAQQAFHRYTAACAAALAASGKGEDAGKLDDKEKTRLRQQALAWLRDNLKYYGEQLQDANARTRQAVQQSLQYWQADPEFDSVRGKEALAQLPEAERAVWQQLWNDVAALLPKAGASP
jgi:tetratricopeptide (TPR) repeat protein